MESNSSSPPGETSSATEEIRSKSNERGKTDEKQSTVHVEPQEESEERSSTLIANDVVERNQSSENDGVPQMKVTSTSDSVGDRGNSFPEEAKDDWSLPSPDEENHENGGGGEEGEGGGGLEDKGGAAKGGEDVTRAVDEGKKEGANLEWGEEEEEEEESETDEGEVEEGDQESDVEVSTRRRRRERREDSEESEESEGECK